MVLRSLQVLKIHPTIPVLEGCDLPAPYCDPNISMDHSEGGDDDDLDIDTHGSCCHAWKRVRVSPGLELAMGPVRQEDLYLWPKF